MITSACGTPSSPLGLAAYPGQAPQCVEQAFRAGINFFFFYGLGQTDFIAGLKPLVAAHRSEIIIASGSGARTPGGLRTVRRKLRNALATDVPDIFFAEYIHPGDDADSIFGSAGVLEELSRWKENGWIRYVGASAHDRSLAKRLVEDPRVDVLMHRFNMAHRKASDEVFPAALATQTPVIAFTATRWGSLLQARDGWAQRPPTAADCYRFCLAHEAVRVVLTAPSTTGQLDENLAVLKMSRLSDEALEQWQRFGDLVYKESGQRDDEFESRWP